VLRSRVTTRGVFSFHMVVGYGPGVRVTGVALGRCAFAGQPQCAPRHTGAADAVTAW
jgi:hypothetical protein